MAMGAAQMILTPCASVVNVSALKNRMRASAELICVHVGAALALVQVLALALAQESLAKGGRMRHQRARAFRCQVARASVAKAAGTISILNFGLAWQRCTMPLHLK